jgi:hypothetical protein
MWKCCGGDGGDIVEVGSSRQRDPENPSHIKYHAP